MFDIIAHDNNGVIKITIHPNEKVIIGRSPDGNKAIRLSDASISRVHAMLEVIGNNLYITDLGSMNGTYIEGKKLGQNQKVELKTMAYLGSIKIDVKRGKVLGVNPQAGSINSGNSNYGKGLRDLLNNKIEIIVGRDPDCDYQINDVTVSRRHAKFSKVGNEYFVEDLGSTNGTFAMATRIKGKHKINETDTIFVGLFAFRLGGPVVDFTRENAISVNQVTKKFKNGYVGLHPITVNIPTGKLVALMGPSGCGKSTFLKTLTGDQPASSGSVKIFGLDLYQNFENLKQKIGYVPQDDIVHRELTVRKTLFFAAKLRLPDADDAEINKRSQEVLQALNMTDDPKILDTKVGELSGGQRKRISIAVELISQPLILFLDEPTSPLDPETIDEFLKCLEGLCKNGTTVVMVTHKPEDLVYADKLIFLGSGGFHVYEGSKDEILTHFSKSNIIKVYSLLKTKEASKPWYDRWYTTKSRTADSNSSQKLNKDKSVNLIHQFYWQTARYFNVKVSNTMNMALIFAQPIIIALLLIFVFENIIEGDEVVKFGNASVLFLMAIAAIWFGVNNAAKEIVSEIPIYRRERMYNLRIGTYLFSKWVVLLFFSLAQLVIFLALLKMKYQEDLCYFPKTLGFLLFVSSCSIVFGLLLSVMSTTTEEVMSILPIALMPQIILSGILSKITSPFIEGLSYFTFGRWGTEGLARIQDHEKETKDFIFLGENHQIHVNLYGDDSLMKLFKSFEGNIAILFSIKIAMIVLIVAKLLSADSKRS